MTPSSEAKVEAMSFRKQRLLRLGVRQTWSWLEAMGLEAPRIGALPLDSIISDFTLSRCQTLPVGHPQSSAPAINIISQQ
jgi:hypothetical protein